MLKRTLAVEADAGHTALQNHDAKSRKQIVNGSKLLTPVVAPRVNMPENTEVSLNLFTLIYFS